MPYRKRRSTRYAKGRTRRSRTRTRRSNQLPAPREKRRPATGVLKLAPADSTVNNKVKIGFEDATPSQPLALTGANGSFQASIFHGKAGEDVELVVALLTAIPGNETSDSDFETAIGAFDPFDDDDRQAPPSSRGFNMVRLHRLANAHPDGAPNMVYSFNRRMKRRFRRILRDGNPAYFAVWAKGSGNISVAYDFAVKYVVQ